MHTEKRNKRSGRDPIIALTMILVLLKVTGLISWSWLWVLSPIWLTLLFFPLYFLLFCSAGDLLKGNGNFQVPV